MSDNLREALEKALETLPVMLYDNGYPSLALSKARILDLLAMYPAESKPAVRGIAEGGGITDEAVNAAWRKFRSTRHDPMRAALEAALPLLGLQQVPTVLLDRAAVEEAIATKVMYYDSSTAVHEVDDNDLAGLTAGVDAVMELAQQVPSREEIEQAIDPEPEHQERDDPWVLWIRRATSRREKADAVLALLSKPAEEGS